MGICGSKKDQPFRPTGFQKEDGSLKGSKDEDLGSIVNEVKLKTDEKKVPEPEPKLEKKETKIEKEKPTQEEKEPLIEKEEAYISGESMQINEGSDKKVLKSAPPEEEIDDEIPEENETIVKEEEIKIAFSHSEASEVNHNRDFLEGLIDTKQSVYSRPNFSNVLMLRETMTQKTTKTQKKETQPPIKETSNNINDPLTPVEKIVIDNFGDADHQYYNLYSMMKPEDFKHEESHPQFDGEYCVMEAEGYVKRSDNL